MRVKYWQDFYLYWSICAVWYLYFSCIKVLSASSTAVFRFGLTPQPSQRALLSKYISVSVFTLTHFKCPVSFYPKDFPLHLAAGKYHCHTGNAECGSGGKWGENQRWRWDAHDSVKQPPAKPEPTAAVCHLYKHTVPPEYSRHRWACLIWSLDLVLLFTFGRQWGQKFGSF